MVQEKLESAVWGLQQGRGSLLQGRGIRMESSLFDVARVWSWEEGGGGVRNEAAEGEGKDKNKLGKLDAKGKGPPPPPLICFLTD